MQKKNLFRLSPFFSRSNRANRKWNRPLGGGLKIESLESRLALTAATLSIFVDGDQVSIPDQIGFDSSGVEISQVRTTDANGTLDINPIADEVLTDDTLGDFFDTWRFNAGAAGNNADAVLSSTELLDNTSDASNSVQMFVNGQISTEFDAYVIQEDDDIVLIYGDNPIVSLNTTFGPIIFELFEDDAPNTVANFLNYVNDGDYEDAFFHRSVPGFVIQGGGFATDSTTFTSVAQFSDIPTDPPVANEPGRLNLRGTIAMAKTSDPDSATNQFFVNLSDNATLDSPSNSGGFTVFGQVLGLETVDEIAGLPITTGNISPYTDLPISADGTLAVIQEVVGLGSITGVKFLDTNADGIRNADEIGVAGATVFIDTNANGTLESTEISAITDSDGRYLLQVAPDAYSVTTITDDAFEVTGSTEFVAIVETGEVVEADPFGQAPVDISAVDDAETINNTGEVTTIAVLANDAVPEGSDILSVTQGTSGGVVAINGDQVDYTPAADFEGQDTFTYTIQDIEGATSTATVTVDVETLVLGSVSGVIHLDRNSDGTQDDDEVGIPGVEVSLSGISDAGVDVDLTTITQDDGSYLFEEVPVGSYTLEKSTSNAVVEPDLDTDGNNVNETTVDVTLGEEVSPDSNFTSTRLRPEYSSIAWFFASSGNGERAFREAMAAAEEDAGNQALADLIRGEGDDTDTTDPTDPDPTDPDPTDPDPTDPDPTDPFATLIATADNYTVNEDEALLQLPSTGVLANDTIPADVTTTIAITGQPTDGTIEIADDGSFAYVANDNHNGTDSFTYELTAGDETSSAVVSIVINPVNDPPEATDDTFEVNEDTGLTLTATDGVLSNDVDVDNDTLTVTLLTATLAGSINLADDGGFTYSPNQDFAGTDRFTYEVTDSTGLTDEGEALINVLPLNDAPVAADISFSTDQDVLLAVDAVMGLVGTVTDAEDNAITTSLFEQAINGVATIASDGSFTYQPNSGFTGTDTFRFVANDTLDSSEPATVSIEVRETDQPSTIVLPAEFSDPSVAATRNVGQAISVPISVEDPDDDVADYMFQLDLDNSGIPATATQPTVDASTGQFEWTPSTTGEFPIRVIVINSAGEANAETILFSILS